MFSVRKHELMLLDDITYVQDACMMRSRRCRDIPCLAVNRPSPVLRPVAAARRGGHVISAMRSRNPKHMPCHAAIRGAARRQGGD
jgi:hypothetical protein